MITKSDFVALLPQGEGETLDFKAKSYDLSANDSKYALIKDVLALANTPRDVLSYIVLGVKKYPDNTYDLLGVDTHPDDADLQSQFAARVRPIPRSSYATIAYQGKSFGVIVILPEPIGPCVALHDYLPGLHGGTVYCRHGSQNAVATSEDLLRIASWISSGSSGASVSMPSESGASLPWEQLVESVHGLESSRRYVLVNYTPDAARVQSTSVIGAIDWSFVADFDPDSELSGMIRAVRDSLQERRALHLVLGTDRPTLNIDRGTYWYFARGLTGSSSWAPEVGSYRDWVRRARLDLTAQITQLAKAIGSAPVTVLALWFGEGLSDHLASVIETASSILGEAVDFTIATRDPSGLQPVADKLGATLVNIPLPHLCAGMATLVYQSSYGSGMRPNECPLPSSSGVQVVLDSKDIQWIEEEIELVHLNAGLLAHDEPDSGSAFLRGNQITWDALALHVDVDRDQTQRLLTVVRRDLDKRDATRVNLYHAPVQAEPL